MSLWCKGFHRLRPALPPIRGLSNSYVVVGLVCDGHPIVTINRRDFYLGRHNTSDSRRRYNRLIAEYLSSPETFSLSTSRKSDAAVSELIVAFLAFVKSEVGDKEYKGIKLAMKPLRSLYGDTCAKDFGTSQYKAVRAVFVREVHPLRKKPRTRQYVNRAMVYVSSLLA